MRAKSRRLARLFTLEVDDGPEQRRYYDAQQHALELPEIIQSGSQLLPKNVHHPSPPCRVYIPKKPGSIRTQLTSPANIPTIKTRSTTTFSCVVFGLPIIVGNNSRKNPPTIPTGPNAASFSEYSCFSQSWCQL